MKTLRVLVVDDNRDAADTLALLLKLDGHKAVAAYGSSDALQKAAELRPQVAFIDLAMPGENGFDLAKKFKADPNLKPTAIVALSGYDLEKYRQECRQIGFVNYLLKPVEYPYLRSMLQPEQANGNG